MAKALKNLSTEELLAELAARNLEVTAKPKMKIVRSLMNGAEIEIPVDTPRSCDPSSELYWSM